MISLQTYFSDIPNSAAILWSADMGVPAGHAVQEAAQGVQQWQLEHVQVGAPLQAALQGTTVRLFSYSTEIGGI
jgi:hypothetical protein